ncbi:RHS repeat domain-containing protein, partial [Aestuariibaculum sediminum]
NLPTSVTLSGGNISYIYDATGVKLSKTVSGTTTYYAGNYVYEGSSLKFFNHPEGYVDAANGYKYVYQYKDHLGNVRLSYMDSNNNGSVNSSEILEENNYYPFGLKHKGYNTNVNSTNIALKYKFGGKEYEEALGLGWYDITARNYDPSISRFMNIDPLADKFPNVTAYNYAINNPLSFIDSDGKSPDPVLSKVIQRAIQSAPVARVIGRINSANYKVFGKEIYDNSNTVLASIPKQEKYIFQGGIWNSISGANEVNFNAKFDFFGTSFSAAGYYQKKSKSGLFNIGEVNVQKTANGGRFTTDVHGNSGYIVDLVNGGSSIIRLSFPDEQTHEAFEKILNNKTDSYLEALFETNPALKELFELAELSDEVHSLYASFNKDNPYIEGSEQANKYLKVLKEYTDRRNTYRKNEREKEFWAKAQKQLDDYYNRLN